MLHIVHTELGHDVYPMLLGSLGFYITKYMLGDFISCDSQDGRNQDAAGPEGSSGGLEGIAWL